MTHIQDAKQVWEESFREQIAIQAFNTSPVEALVRTVSYYLRARHRPEEQTNLHFLEVGCGAGPNLIWLAQKGIRVSGVDISPTALQLCRQNLERAGFSDRIGHLIEASASEVPLESESFDGILESCVFQHIEREDRVRAFREVKRLLKPGGVFVGNMLATGHTTFQQKQAEQLPDDPGSVVLADGKSKVYLTNIGLAHFFSREEYFELLDGFSTVDPCLSTYYLPQEEARRRGYEEYLQSMWTVYAVK